MDVLYVPLNAKLLSCFNIDIYLLGIEKPTIANKLSLTLSADHRVFEGKVGGMWYWNTSWPNWKVGKKFDSCCYYVF